MAAVEEGRYDIVLTHSFDRMSRGIVNMSRTVQTFQKHSVSFVSIKETLDFSGPLGPVLMVGWTPQLGQRRGQVKRDSRWKV